MIAMILAAGRGERLRPLTDSVPKPLLEVRGQSLLERHLASLSEAGIRDVVINLGWLGEQIIARVADGSRFGLNVRYSDERDGVLDTGGGIRRALPLLGHEPFLVVNADVYTDMPVPDVALQAEQVGHLVLVPTPGYRDRGDFDLDGGLLRNGGAQRLTFSGVAVYRPEFFEACGEGRFSIVPMLRKAADEGRLQGSVYEGVWEDVGTEERLASINVRTPESKRPRRGGA